MRKLIALSSVILLTSCALHAKPVTWMERSKTVHAETDDSQLSKKSTDSNASETSHKVTLATGQETTLLGGVYVKSNNPSLVMQWAADNGYTAKESPWIKGAVTVDTTPEKSIAVANLIAKIPEVTTAAPRYKTKKVLK